MKSLRLLSALIWALGAVLSGTATAGSCGDVAHPMVERAAPNAPVVMHEAGHAAHGSGEHGAMHQAASGSNEVTCGDDCDASCCDGSCACAALASAGVAVMPADDSSVPGAAGSHAASLIATASATAPDLHLPPPRLG